MRLFALALVAFCSVCLANPESYHLEKTPIGPYLEIPANSFSRIKLPISILNEAKLFGGEDLTLIFPDRTGFTLSTFSDKKVGFEGVDMRTWPLYALGLANGGNEPEPYIEELQGVRKIILSPDNEIFRIATLRQHNLIIYLALGHKRSTIFVTSADIKDRITVISVDGMTEQAIRDVLLQGIVQ